MPRGDHLGEFEYLVMLALLRLKDDAYGMAVRREIEDRARRSVSIGSVYATLDRLETKGLVRAEPRIDDSGRARKSFALTGLGAEAMRERIDAISRMTEGLSVSKELDAV